MNFGFRLLAPLLVGGCLLAAPPETLPGTTLWNFPKDIAAEQYVEMRAFYERQGYTNLGPTGDEIPSFRMEKALA